MGWFIYHLVRNFKEIPDLIPKFKLLSRLGHKRKKILTKSRVVLTNLTNTIRLVRIYRHVRNFEEIPDLIPKFKLLYRVDHKWQNTDKFLTVWPHLMIHQMSLSISHNFMEISDLGCKF